MERHTRAVIAAAAFAFITGKTVAGVHDHASGEDLRIAAEARGDLLQGVDGERAVKFGGALPEIYDAGDEGYFSLEIDGATAKGYDRKSSVHYALTVTDRMVQLYDHGRSEWFTLQMQVAEG